MPKLQSNLQSNIIKIALQHGCSLVNLPHILHYLFLRTPLDGCFRTVKEITEKFMEKVKIKNGKAQVKKSCNFTKD